MTTETESPPTPIADDGERKIPVRLNRGAVFLLRALLAGQGWAKKPVHIRRGKKLRAMLPKLSPPEMDGVAAEEWEAVLVEGLHVPESLRKTGADCIKAYVEGGKLGATDAVECLITEFGVVEE
jgi:hypothetical protein